MGYAAASDLVARYDVRIIGELANDVNTRESPGQVLSDPNVQAALNDATGLINSYALIGLRYAVTDLENLTGPDQSLLIRICCDVAFAYLVQRRGKNPENYPQIAETADMMARLRDGQQIFNVASDVADGQVNAQFPSIANVAQVNLAAWEARPFFGRYRHQNAPPFP